jgi:small ligand-binding sensory domain FIST
MVALPSLPWLARREQGAWCRTALARNASLQVAVEEVTRQLSGTGEADLALVFASTSYASDLPRLLPLLRTHLRAARWLGCAGGGVVGTESSGVARELEQDPALSVTLLRLPGAELNPFALTPSDLPDLDGPPDAWWERVGMAAKAGQSMLLLIDPSSSAINDVINGLDFAYPGCIKLGGIAGQHSAPHGSLLFENQVVGGVVGCVIGGSWQLDPIVAQGCRPIGPVLDVQQAERNILIEVSSGDQRHSPVAALQAILNDLSPGEREQVKHSLFLGVGPSDFTLGG